MNKSLLIGTAMLFIASCYQTKGVEQENNHVTYVGQTACFIPNPIEPTSSIVEKICFFTPECLLTVNEMRYELDDKGNFEYRRKATIIKLVPMQRYTIRELTTEEKKCGSIDSTLITIDIPEELQQQTAIRQTEKARVEGANQITLYRLLGTGYTRSELKFNGILDEENARASWNQLINSLK